MPARFFRAFDEKFDPAGGVRVAIRLEMQIGNIPEAQADSKLMTQIMPRMVKSIEGLLLLPLLAADGNADAGITAIRTDVDVGDFDIQKPGIVQFEGNEFRQFFANGFGYAQCAAFVHRSYQQSAISYQPNPFY